MTDFSLKSPPKALVQSIKAISITHSLGLIPFGARYKVVCGNRRWKIAQELKLLEVPARIFPEGFSEEDQLRLNLEDNYAHRIYSDIEKASILLRLTQSGVDEKRLIYQYMPILGLERSKNLAIDYLKAGKLSTGMKTILHDLKAPLKAFKFLFRWDERSRTAGEGLLASIKPGANKLRELLELIDETACRDEIPPIEIIERDDLQSILKDDDSERRYKRVHGILFPLRYPKLSALRKEVWLALDQLKLDPKTKIRTDENFEKDDIRIELSFKTLEDLQSQIEKLSMVTQSDPMRKLIAALRSC